MAVELTLELGDVTEVASDLLLLKHAQGFYGADAKVAEALVDAGVCKVAHIRPAPWEGVIVPTRGVIAAERVMFIGTPSLVEFRYKEMRQFARLAVETIAARKTPARTITTTVHGAGYGLDVEESLQWLAFGFQAGLAGAPAGLVERITFVDRVRRRIEGLEHLVRQLSPLHVPASLKAAVATHPPYKRSVFVAMPFTEDFEDVYRYGIYDVVRRLGYVCEKVDESAFTGNIVAQIETRIRNAAFVVADMSLERPNVYLEVGFAWGLGKPVILVAKDGQKLHFDLSHHKCIFYRTIGKLSEALERLIREAFGPKEGAV
jgi:hypothetical protein